MCPARHTWYCCYLCIPCANPPQIHRESMAQGTFALSASQLPLLFFVASRHVVPTPLSHLILPSDIPPCARVSRRGHLVTLPCSLPLPCPRYSTTLQYRRPPAAPTAADQPLQHPPTILSAPPIPPSKHPSKLALCSHPASAIPYPYHTYPYHTCPHETLSP